MAENILVERPSFYYIFRMSFIRNGKTYRRKNGRPFKIKVKT